MTGRSEVGQRWTGSGGPVDKEAAVADPSFDVVSKVDRQEVDNALNQATKSSPPGLTSAGMPA